MNLLLILSGVLVLLFIFNLIMRKVLNVEKRSHFLMKSVNRTHSIIDWGIRITFIVLIVIGLAYAYENPEPLPWFVHNWMYIFIISFLLLDVVRAYFEWKHDPEKNRYLHTLSQVAFLLVVVIVLYTTGMFGVLG
ncbi:DUF4181 domain-containing protein [Geomicrobium sp. JCM 19039]|uniref:DUF4181 domain-containing protein n=1 Tax=Geomicrobium sp. JCM 19039 TaxID=1460636 RepID=UPI0005AB7CDE|nr:DUF4181 domain-containing protein [Geomicrobium sp. JCM 19039]